MPLILLFIMICAQAYPQTNENANTMLITNTTPAFVSNTTAEMTNTVTTNQILIESVIASPIDVSGKVFVLCYHTFYKKYWSWINIEPWRFEEQILSIRNLGYRFVDIRDILSNRISGNSNVLITIDDGEKSSRNIEAILTKYSIKPVFFVYSEAINYYSGFLKPVDLYRFITNGWTIGSHGYYHLALSKSLYKNDKKAFIKEIDASKLMLEKKTGLTVQLFAYPYGAYAPITLDTVKNSGYSYAFTTVEKPVILPIISNKNPFLLPRYTVTRKTFGWILKELKKNMADSAKKE